MPVIKQKVFKECINHTRIQFFFSNIKYQISTKSRYKREKNIQISFEILHIIMNNKIRRQKKKFNINISDDKKIKI